MKYLQVAGTSTETCSQMGSVPSKEWRAFTTTSHPYGDDEKSRERDFTVLFSQSAKGIQ